MVLTALKGMNDSLVKIVSEVRGGTADEATDCAKHQRLGENRH